MKRFDAGSLVPAVLLIIACARPDDGSSRVRTSVAVSDESASLSQQLPAQEHPADHFESPEPQSAVTIESGNQPAFAPATVLHEPAAAHTHAQHAASPVANARKESAAQDTAPHADHAAPPVANAREESAAQDTAHVNHVPPHNSEGTPARLPTGADSAHAHAEHSDSAAHAVGLAQPERTDHLQHGLAAQVQEQHADHGAAHDMPMLDFGAGIMVVGMGQVFPTFTFALPTPGGSPLEETGFYLTQPAIMANVESPGSRIVLRTTLNFEGITQADGELTFGGWGEGFLDMRHPHTLVHEFMLSANFFRASHAISISAGKGFAPYGTDDPMSRPVLKYPTNHHLSQALERWTLNGVAQVGQWSVEAAVFGGAEPTGPYDFSNIESFADSWSARVTRRFGSEDMGSWPWELSLSHASIVEHHEEESATTNLYNAAVRHEDKHGKTRMYALLEASLSDPEHFDGFFSVLAEGSMEAGRHKPYARVEYARRPEFERLGPIGTKEYFRYDHEEEPIGATRWLIITGGYGFTLVGKATSLRPYVEAQYQHVRADRGGIEPQQLFGRNSFFGLSIGTRVFLGGEAMRMGAYGVLDPMTRMHRPMMMTATAPHH